jgi:allophanate hydrolase subunit 1
MMDDSLSFSRAGTTVTTATTTSAAIAIPPNSSGSVPNYCYVVATASPGGYIKFGTSSVTATNTGMLIGTTPVIIKTAGNTHFAHIWETSAVKINIIPLEN